MSRLAEAAYALYVDYLGLKLHFNGEIDWRPGILEERLDPVSLTKRSDWKVFVQICETRGEDRLDNRTALVTLFVDSPRSWIGEVLGEDFKRKHLARIQRLRRLDETFLEDLLVIQRSAAEARKDFIDFVVTGNPPHIIKLLGRRGGVCVETLSLLHHATGFADTVTSHPLWERQRKACDRYAPLLAPYIDLEQVKELVCNTICAPAFDVGASEPHFQPIETLSTFPTVPTEAHYYGFRL